MGTCSFSNYFPSAAEPQIPACPYGSQMQALVIIGYYFFCRGNTTSILSSCSRYGDLFYLLFSIWSKTPSIQHVLISSRCWDLRLLVYFCKGTTSSIMPSWPSDIGTFCLPATMKPPKSSMFRRLQDTGICGFSYLFIFCGYGGATSSIMFWRLLKLAVLQLECRTLLNGEQLGARLDYNNFIIRRRKL